MPYEVDKYTYQTFYSEADKAFVATVLEFPSLSWVDENRQVAAEGIVRLVAEVAEDMETSEEELPAPLGERRFSGKLSLRLTPEQHRRVALQAAQQNVSINRYIAARV